ncbi:hypothetical protein BGZ93_004484 [Podila epicladia]|nr:hypothetical protein BGZ92_011333 [Podila epicladia]KAG0096482.1 hypothetical protein BGZ93_004484 [Podila epicladia]
MGVDDPASAHQSCIETLSQLEQDLAEIQNRFIVLQQECDNLRRSNEQMVMDHVQEKRARKYHEESIQRRKDKESKRQSVCHDQLRQVLGSNKAIRAKVRALERGQIEAEREQREELVHLTGLVEQMVAHVGERTITTKTTATKMSEQDAVTPGKRGMEQTKTPSGASPTLILSPNEILSQAGTEEGVPSLKSLHAQKCHTTLLQLQTLIDQLPKDSAAPVRETLKGYGVDFDVDGPQKQRRRTKRQSGSSASSGETLVVSMATTHRKLMKEEQEHEHEPSALARQLLLEQQYRHQVEIEHIKQQCVALYRASLAEVRAEMKSKLAKMKKTSVSSFGH